MKTFEVIMAGGGGTRFWPLSRQRRPKQLLNISGGDIMLNETIVRHDDLVDREDVYVVTNEEQKAVMKELIVGGIPFSNLLAEPVGRNTAPCILFAAGVLSKKNKQDGVMCVFPADHHIGNVKEYQRVISRAVTCAEESGHIVTIGIKPTFPATGYGYIKRGQEKEDGIFQVERFVEKPKLSAAQDYIASGDYSWNSGVFIFKISTIMEAYRKLLPKMASQMEEILEAYGTDRQQEVLDRIYPQLESVSIDYGIMEHSDNVLVMEGDYGWNDVGSLDELGSLYEADADENVTIGEHLLIDSKGCITKGNNRLVTLIGVEDLIVVDTEDTVLVCRKDCAQKVKQAVEQLKEDGRTQYL